MVQLQLLNYVLQKQDDSILTENEITKEYFLGYEAEYEFIQAHKEKYGNVPDKETFLEKFPSFDILEVNESSKYLVDTIREEHLYTVSVPVVQKFAELLKTDANAAAEYLKSQTQFLQPNYSIGGIDITKQADTRYSEYIDRKQNQKNWYFESGFTELDDIIHGIQRGEELFVLFARLGQGKSWILAKMTGHVWRLGFNVGYVSPEMSYNSVGFRFDTLFGHFSNRNLMRGEDEENYETYIQELQGKENRFIVATPADFNRSITVSKLRNFVKQYKLDLLAIDGIKYLTDERGRKGDNLTTSLTNISEDLMELSVELGIPVLVVVQANRSGASDASEDGTPSIESIRDSDGIAHNASKVISLKQKADGILQMEVQKNRFGSLGDRLNYLWDIDTGKFTFVSSDSRGTRRRASDDKKNTENKPHRDKKDVF